MVRVYGFALSVGGVTHFGMTNTQQRELLRSAQLTAREAIALSYWLFNGWSMADIAEHVGVSKGAIAQKIQNARKKLQVVGIAIPEQELTPIRRAKPTDPRGLDISEHIVAVA